MHDKIIVAISEGENGRILPDGSKSSYDTYQIDKAIVDLTKKNKPNFLFLSHALSFSEEVEVSYFEVMKSIYGVLFNCNSKQLLSSKLEDREYVEQLIDWADIIYEGGGDTSLMINLWKKTNFDKVLYNAWNNGKIICGISAGAVCWFKSCNSDYIDNFETKFEEVPCLNWINLFITPHAEENGRYESTKDQLKNNKMVGLLMSNGSALVIKNNEFKILSSMKNSFVIKSFWEDNKYYEEKIDNKEYKNIELLKEKR